MIMQPHLQIQSEINTIISRAFEAGLIQKWITNNERIKLTQNVESFENVVLTIDHLFGCWFVIGSGSSLAILTIIGEHLVHRHVYGSSTKKIKFWVIFDLLFFEPSRNFWNLKLND